MRTKQPPTTTSRASDARRRARIRARRQPHLDGHKLSEQELRARYPNLPEAEIVGPTFPSSHHLGYRR
jgi:hypothetical protein